MSGQEGVRVVTIAGHPIRMTGNPDDPYFSSIENIAAAETPFIAWADRHLPRDATMLDAGGNIGLTALILATLRPSGQVHVFEASPENARLLRRNLEMNLVRNCIVVEAALGDAPGRIALAGSGAAVHVLSAAQPTDDLQSVPMITLDDYAREHGLPRVDLIKRDVEGYEPAVLAGAAGLIARDAPPIYMEFNAWCLPYAHGFDAFAFAHALWDAFEVLQIDGDGNAAAGGDVTAFLHNTIVSKGAVADLLLRPRPGCKVPDMNFHLRDGSGWALQRMRQLEQELSAMRSSTSWRITAPLRAVRRFLRLPRA
jgi:FkbM family methyltransferase